MVFAGRRDGEVWAHGRFGAQSSMVMVKILHTALPRCEAGSVKVQIKAETHSPSDQAQRLTIVCSQEAQQFWKFFVWVSTSYNDFRCTSR